MDGTEESGTASHPTPQDYDVDEYPGYVPDVKALGP